MLCLRGELGERVHEGGFAAAGGADDTQKLPRPHGEADAVEHQELPVAFGQVLDDYPSVLDGSGRIHIFSSLAPGSS
jgi:hypothetical protein